MHIQLVSDLHLETLRDQTTTGVVLSPLPDADVLVIAGDIGLGTQAISFFKDWPVPVVYVAGNHEFYRGDIDAVTADLRAQANGTSIRFLECDGVVINGVRFLGTTLWTDYAVYGTGRRTAAMEQAEYDLNDHKLIRYRAGIFKARDALERFTRSVTWLEEQLAQPFDGQTVVITHHGPHWNSVHSKYQNDGTLLSAAFVSDLTAQMGKSALWLHGHVHDSFDYTVNGTRVVTNPRGYRSKNGFENSSFNAKLLLAVPTLPSSVWQAT